MVDILDKIHTLRSATATAILKLSKKETVQTIESNQVPKGNIFEFSRAAGLLAIKKTSDVIPDCHPLPIEYAAIHSEIKGLEIHIYVDVSTIYKTGVEVEAMHGASVVALTMYDMLKPLDNQIEIQTIKLLDKKGGKKAFHDTLNFKLKIAVIVCSDSVFQNKKEDKAGKEIIQILNKYNLESEEFIIIPDEKTDIQLQINKLTNAKFDLILITGGTGLSPRDITPESVKELLQREIPGIMEAARSYGQQRTPYAMLSRGIAGMIKNTLVITLPGSTKGVRESMNALFPFLLHIFKVSQGLRHD